MMNSFFRKLTLVFAFFSVCGTFVTVSAQETVPANSFTFEDANKMSNDVFFPIKDGLQQFKNQYELASATTTNPTVAATAKSNSLILNTKYDRLNSILDTVSNTYQTELGTQKDLGKTAAEANDIAANASLKKYTDLFNTSLKSTLTETPRAPTQLSNYFNSIVLSRLNDFTLASGKIKRGAPSTSAEVTQLTDSATALGANATQASIASGNKVAEPDAGNCSLLSFKPADCLDGAVGWLIKTTLVNAAIAIFYIAGLFLHNALLFGLVTATSIIKTGGGIYSLWLFSRNLVLTAALFAALYLIAYSLLNQTKSVARPTVSVILFALLSGFSFSVATWLYDGSNLVTSSLYSTISPGWAEASSLTNPTIATQFMDRLGYQNVRNMFTGAETDSILAENSGSSIATNLLLAASLLYNSYILIMMGILFVVRDLGLLACIIFSPMLFVDQVLPTLGGYAKKFRSFFFGLLAVGPVFMLLMYIGLRIVDVVSIGTKGTPKTFGLVFFTLASVTAVFYFTNKVCRSLSGALGDAALGAMGGIASKAMIATPLGAAGRLSAFAGNQTLGRAARYAEEKMRESPMRAGYFGSKLYGAANYAGNTATYDFNNSKLIANAKNGIAQKAGFKPQESFVTNSKGYTETREIIKKQLDSDLKSYENVEDPEIRNALMSKRASGKFIGGVRDGVLQNGLLSTGMTGQNFQRSALALSDKERGAAVKRATSSIESTAKKEVEDDLNALNFENLSEQQQNPEKTKHFKSEIENLLTKAKKKGMEGIFVKKLQQKLLQSIVEEIKGSNLDPKDADFTKKAEAKLHELTDGTGIASLLADDLREATTRSSVYFNNQMDAYRAASLKNSEILGKSQSKRSSKLTASLLSGETLSSAGIILPNSSKPKINSAKSASTSSTNTQSDSAPATKPKEMIIINPLDQQAA